MAGCIFCIENWSSRLDDRSSIRPLLDLLETNEAIGSYFHQRVDTAPELHHYLRRFAGLESYQVLYLAMHGNRGGVHVGSKRVSLEALISWSEGIDRPPELDGRGRPAGDWALDLSGKAVYLGSCSTLRVTPERMSRFREETGASLVCGYRRDVDWFDAAGFEVILLTALTRAMSKRRPAAPTAVRRLKRQCGDLLETLGFISEPNWEP